MDHSAAISGCRRQTEDRKIFVDVVKSMGWTPARMAPDNGCLLAVVDTYGQVCVLNLLFASACSCALLIVA